MSTYTVFDGPRLVARGSLDEVAAAARARGAEGATLLAFSDDSGSMLELDPRALPAAPAADSDARGRGRPKLGVTAREVTLLPRHWDWLAAQPGGASATLRRLVDAARASGSARERGRRAQESAYRVMQALAGDLPGFEEASRALFAGDGARFAECSAAWPADLRDYAAELAAPAFAGS